jgi:hypothetical protein
MAKSRGAKGGARGNAHQRGTHWSLSQARASKALERMAGGDCHPLVSTA